MAINLISFTQRHEDEFYFEYVFSNKIHYVKRIIYDPRDSSLWVKYDNNARSHIIYALHPAAVDLLYDCHGYFLGREHVISWVSKFYLLHSILLPDIVYYINLQMCKVLISNDYLKWHQK